LCSPLAQRLGTGPGHSVEIQSGGRSWMSKVAAVAQEYTFGGQALVVHQPFGRERFGLGGFDAFLISGGPGDAGAASDRLEGLASEHGLLLQSFDELRGVILGLTDSFRSRLRMLAVLALATGAVGIANALMMSVVGQARELGLLRLIGLERAGL